MPEQEPHGAVSHDKVTAEVLLPSYVVGVDIGGTNLRLAVANLQGNIVARLSRSTVGIRDAAIIVDLICEGIDQLLAETSLRRTSVVAMGVGAPGIVDVDQGVVVATSYLMGWRDVPLRFMLEDALQIPTAIDNDVNLAAVGEGRAGQARGVEDFVFIAVGTGIGAGITVHGKLVRGRGWSAGEIGYMLVPGASEVTVEGDQPGALEELAGGEGIRSQWQKRWSREGSMVSRDATTREIVESAARGEPFAVEVLDLAARSLASAIYNISLVLNCELFILGGSLGLNSFYFERVQEMFSERFARTDVRLKESELGADAQLIGAVFVAIDLAGPSVAVSPN